METGRRSMDRRPVDILSLSAAECRVCYAGRASRIVSQMAVLSRISQTRASQRGTTRRDAEVRENPDDCTGTRVKRCQSKPPTASAMTQTITMYSHGDSVTNAEPRKGCSIHGWVALRAPYV